MSGNPASPPAYQLVRVPTGRTYSTGVAYLLFCLTFLGVAGIQHFYLGHYARGLVWLFTWGLLGIGSVYDLFALGAQVSDANLRQSVIVAAPLP